MSIKNVLITDTMLGREDHGILTFMIYIKGDGFECGIGGYSLDSYDAEHKCRVFRSESMEIISVILDVVGVDSWEQLKGKYIRVKENGWGSPIYEIGNLIEDKGINFKDFFKLDVKF